MIELWNRFERSLIGLLALLALVVACVQMLTRYLAPNYAPDWAEEVLIYLLMWGIWLSGSALVAEDRHVRADLFLRLLSPQVRRWAEFLNTGLGLGFCALVAVNGAAIIDLALRLDERSDSSLQFPLWLYYASLPAGAGLMALRYLHRLWELVQRHAVSNSPQESNP